MKQLFWLGIAWTSLWICGCSTAKWSDPRWAYDPGGPRFRDEASTDVVLRFVSWDAITITKPDTREGGFLKTCQRAEAERLLARPGIERHLAVVVCCRTLSEQQQADLQAAWRSVFSGLGFERLVFVRARDGVHVNGCAVLDDMQLKRGFAAASPKVSNPQSE